jgi:hypothetical protein
MNKSYSIVRVHGFWSSMMLTNLNSQNHAWSFLVWTPVHCLPLHMLTPNVPMRENFHLSCLLESPNLERTWMQEHDLHCHTLVEPVPQTQTIQMIHKCLSSLCSPSAMHIAIRWWIIVIWQPVLHKNPSASAWADCDRNQIITLISLLKWFVSRWLQCQYLQCSHPTLAMDQFVPYW